MSESKMPEPQIWRSPSGEPYIRQASVRVPENLTHAIDAIANDGAREILDADGLRVGVSREALDMVLSAARELLRLAKGV